MLCGRGTIVCRFIVAYWRDCVLHEIHILCCSFVFV